MAQKEFPKNNNKTSHTIPIKWLERTNVESWGFHI